ncbi:MAG: hypothetical protein K2H70_01455 [Bacteroidales bacterium]|nr:hypothetical protein [Bacteroidales bacterium]
MVVCGYLAFLFSACVKPKEFSEIPYLEYRSASISGMITNTGDTSLVLDLTFYFQDGDGDIGREDSEPILFFALAEKVSDSLYEQVYAVNDTGGRFAIEYAYMLNPIEAVTANGAVYGTMTWRMEEFGDIAREFQGRTIRLDIRLFDRQWQKSNIIHSEDFRI